MAKPFAIGILGAILIAIHAVFTPALADDAKRTKQQLDQMLAPIALYPDDLLTNVLMASTYPLDVVEADRWRREPANAKLKGDALAKALEDKDWDPSIKALVQFPQVLQMMSDKLEWMQNLGDAFLAQQNEVMDEIQVLRGKADEAGYLTTTKQQTVAKETSSGGSPIYVIEPTDPETVYAPVYQPEVVYGSWWYPDYPPYSWDYPGARFVNGVFWGGGIAVASGIWGWNHCDWHHHNIDVDVNKWNRINVNRAQISSNTWAHRADHRGPVPYRDRDVREKFSQGDRHPRGNDEFRGHDRAEIKDRLKNTDHSRLDDRAGREARNKMGDRAGGRTGQPGQQVRERAGDNAKAHGNAGNINRAIDRPSARKSPPGALDVRRGADVRRNADRGRASRVSMAGRGHVGGGARFGGGHAGGGRRR